MINMLNIEKAYPMGVGKYFVLRRITLDIRFRDQYGPGWVAEPRQAPGT
jgi:hypothetical protein